MFMLRAGSFVATIIDRARPLARSSPTDATWVELRKRAGRRQPRTAREVLAEQQLHTVAAMRTSRDSRSAA
jgi:hypothetical protein